MFYSCSKIIFAKKSIACFLLSEQNFSGAESAMELPNFKFVVFLLFLFCTTAITALFLKTTKDLIVENDVFVEFLLTVQTLAQSCCTAQCSFLTRRKANLMTFRFDNSRCECYFASLEFRDSRKSATDLEDKVILIEGLVETSIVFFSQLDSYLIIVPLLFQTNFCNENSTVSIYL